MKERDTEGNSLNDAHCASCGAKLKGRYCRKCGEKKIVPEKDFSLAKFWSQTLGHFIHFDARSIRTFKLLLFQPGELTKAWIEGRRIGYLKPLQVFLVAGLLFYFFLPSVTAYYSSSRDLSIGFREYNWLNNSFHFDVETALTAKAAAHQIDAVELDKTLKASAAQASRKWLFALIPFWGAWIFLFFRRQIPWLVPQLLFALHGLAFYILTDLFVHLSLNLLGITKVGPFIVPLLMLLFSAYLLLAIRRVYGVGWPVAIYKTLAVMAGFIALLFLYRQIVTILTLLTL